MEQTSFSSSCLSVAQLSRLCIMQVKVLFLSFVLQQANAISVTCTKEY